MSKEKTIDSVIDDAMTVTRKAGAALVQAGLNKLKNDYNERLVAFVAGTMNQITTLQTRLDETQIYIQFQKDRLQAINDGKFRVNAHGNLYFDEVRLNAGL